MLSGTIKLNPTVQSSSFHTSVVAQRYGRQNRSRPRKNFYRPNWRYLLNLQNLHYHELDSDNQFNKVLPYFSLPNYPIGDGNIRRRKELVAPFDSVKKKYYDLFPDDRQTYLNDYRRDAGEWYRAPVDRFIACMARRLADSEKEMTLDEAFELALQDKKYEEEARRIEFKVQKEQAEALFGYEEKDWLAEQHKQSKFAEDFDQDPREDEKAAFLKEQKLQILVNQCILNPKKPKIKMADTGLEFFEVVRWLTLNPQYKVYFHESIYWGDVPYHELFLEDNNSVEAKEGDVDHDEGIYYTDELDPDAKLLQGQEDAGGDDKERNKIKAAKKALENDTLMEDLNLNMSTWAKDLLEYFSDATDRKDVYPNQAEEIGWAQEGRDKLVREMSEITDALIDRSFLDNADNFPRPGQIFKDGPDEVLQEHERKRPYVSASLEEELSSLFRKVPR